MQVLEEILEEIDEEIRASIQFQSRRVYGLQKARDIIRKHMNNEWIPVDEQLPDNSEDVLVTTDVGLITFGCLLNGKWITDQESDYPIAWRPLPEPYRPERECMRHA